VLPLHFLPAQLRGLDLARTLLGAADNSGQCARQLGLTRQLCQQGLRLKILGEVAHDGGEPALLVRLHSVIAGLVVFPELGDTPQLHTAFRFRGHI